MKNAGARKFLVDCLLLIFTIDVYCRSKVSQRYSRMFQNDYLFKSIQELVFIIRISDVFELAFLVQTIMTLTLLYFIVKQIILLKYIFFAGYTYPYNFSTFNPINSPSKFSFDQLLIVH